MTRRTKVRIIFWTPVTLAAFIILSLTVIYY